LAVVAGLEIAKAAVQAAYWIAWGVLEACKKVVEGFP
jgi:hypothetical protein